MHNCTCTWMGILLLVVYHIYFDQLTPKFGLYKIPKLSQQFKQGGEGLNKKEGTAFKAGTNLVCLYSTGLGGNILRRYYVGRISCILALDWTEM